jgi:energy-coupling factor transporter transmembrane protein EcfT
MGASNYIVGILNFVTFLLSIPIIAAGVWLANQHNVECYKYLEGPVIGVGVFILLISLLGFVGACYRMRFLLWIYLVAMLLLILLLFCFTIFAFVVTNKAAGDVVSNKGFKEYKLGDYTTWLQRQIQNPSNWAKVESCLSQAKVCDSLNTDYPNVTAFNQSNLSPIQVYVSIDLFQSNPSLASRFSSFLGGFLCCFSCRDLVRAATRLHDLFSFHQVTCNTCAGL